MEEPYIKNLLLTGPPGCVLRLAERMGDLRLAGFYTAEVREGGSRVGGYGVETAAFAQVVVMELGRSAEEVDLMW
jgi:nucleoside-triphosphatase THEP1